jgi:antitoxin component of RelBE/YafQ-DinJ toxin-antitoxin module
MKTPCKAMRIKNESMNQFRELVKKLKLTQSEAFELLLKEFVENRRLKKGA